MARSGGHAAQRAQIGPEDPPADAAHEAGLVYTTDDKPGIKRIRKGKGFEYLGPDGRRVRDKASLERIRSLVIPPAWEHVWISTRPRGNLQATRRDARGRRQHRYHASWRRGRADNRP